MKRESPGPYESFKNDRARLWALISRDVRIVSVAALFAGAAGTAAPAVRAMMLRWLG